MVKTQGKVQFTRFVRLKVKAYSSWREYYKTENQKEVTGCCSNRFKIHFVYLDIRGTICVSILSGNSLKILTATGVSQCFFLHFPTAEYHELWADRAIKQLIRYSTASQAYG